MHSDRDCNTLRYTSFKLEPNTIDVHISSSTAFTPPKHKLFQKTNLIFYFRGHLQKMKLAIKPKTLDMKTKQVKQQAVKLAALHVGSRDFSDKFQSSSIRVIHRISVKGLRKENANKSFSKMEISVLIRIKSSNIIPNHCNN